MSNYPMISWVHSPEQLESFRRDLQNAKAYFVALQTALQAKSERLTGWDRPRMKQRRQAKN